MRIHHRLRSVLAFTAPLLFTREQPQEHSHDKYLRKVNEMLWVDNRINVTDPVFGLLTDSGAEYGKGFISDVACLQMAVADVAYTNAKRLSDTEGMVSSLIYRTLERNTSGVGVKSSICNSMNAINPEIAALEQHQDPASDGALDHNRAVILELARQLSLIGGVNATRATDASTFSPGPVRDSKGNSCNEPNCIYENNRLQVLVTNDEIASYVSQCVATVTISTTFSVTQTGPTQTAAQTSSRTSSSAAAPATRLPPPPPSGNPSNNANGAPTARSGATR